MAENTPAAPAQPTQPQATPAPVSPAVAQRFADPDMLVRANIRGKEEIVPVKVAVADYQTKEAAKLAIAEANRIKAEAHIDREHAERWRRLEHDLKTNPEQAFAGLERLSGVTRAAQFDPSVTASAPPSDDPKTRVYEERLRRLEENQNQVLLKTRVSEVLDSFEAYKQDPELRSLAEKQILAMQIVDPSSDPMDVARDVHTFAMKRESAAATQQRDQRQQNIRAMPNVPANVGMPDLSDIPQGKDGDTKDTGSDGMSTFKRNFMKAAARFNAMASGQQV